MISHDFLERATKDQVTAFFNNRVSLFCLQFGSFKIYKREWTAFATNTRCQIS
jgi:hypothetical protein